MSLKHMVPLLMFILAGSVAAMGYGATHRDAGWVAMAAVVFAIAVIGVALRTNIPMWREKAPEGEAVPAMRRNVRLAAIIYGWGAAALFAMYPLAGLKWQHGWQYGLGAALIAAGFMIYAHRLGKRQHAVMPPLSLTVLHGLAVAAGVAFLVGSGKLETARSDWGANLVFLWGGFSILALCAIAAVTQMRLHAQHTA